jgi:hypothetical protein
MIRKVNIVEIFNNFSARSSSLGGMRTGFFHNFKQKEVLLKKWDKYHEGNVSVV